MTYRELLNLYKQGKLDDVRKKEVEAAIEKQDAISEFLYEEGEIPEFSDLESENAENPENKEWLAGQKNNQKDYAVFTCFYACISGLFIWKSRGSSGSSIKSTEAFQGGTCKQKC